MIAPRIGVEQGRRLRDLMAERILRKEHEAEESGAIDLRLMLLGRMLASSLADPSGKEREMVGMVEKSQMGLRSKCVQFICEDLHRRIDLANQWLHAEAAAHVRKTFTRFNKALHLIAALSPTLSFLLLLPLKPIGPLFVFTDL